jgi:hypothetical protein
LTLPSSVYVDDVEFIVVVELTADKKVVRSLDSSEYVVMETENDADAPQFGNDGDDNNEDGDDNSISLTYLLTLGSLCDDGARFEVVTAAFAFA